MKTFEEQKKEVIFLNEKYKQYLEKEFWERDYIKSISDPENFIEDIYYHQANSYEEKMSILKNWFDCDLVEKSNCWIWRGLYVWRDKKALISFYDPNWNYWDYTIKIKWKFNFFDYIERNIKLDIEDIEEKILEQWYDWIRYYDPDATWEEIVIFNLEKVFLIND
jgi:hypothetical protein